LRGLAVVTRLDVACRVQDGLQHGTAHVGPLRSLGAAMEKYKTEC
jgi:hypothetical protein